MPTHRKPLGPESVTAAQVPRSCTHALLTPSPAQREPMAQSAVKLHLCHVLGSRDLPSGKRLWGSLGLSGALFH